MDLNYRCPHCGVTSKIPLSQLAAGTSIACPACGAASGNKPAGSEPPPQRFDASLNLEQEQAATYDGAAGGVLVLAGAGTGKTRTMIARALFLLKVKKAEPSRIAMLTFTRRAAHEIEERLEREIPGVKHRIFVGTIHAFCLMLMHRYLALFPFPEINILDRDDQRSLLKRIRSSLCGPKGKIDNQEGVVPPESTLESIFSYVSNCRITLSEYFQKHPQNFPETAEYVQNIHRQYQEYKQKKYFLDFDDILLATAQALETNSELRQRVQNAFDHLLVDEMQDTSPIQWDIFRSLYPPIQLFCVGDDAQSIYSFRGADFDSVHHFCERLPNAVTLKLTENYRSYQQILDLSNLLLDNSPLGYDKHLNAHRGKGKSFPQFANFQMEEDEAKFIAKSIVGKLRNGVPPSEIMVLLRYASCARHLEYMLKSIGIPYRMIGGPSFLQAAHVKDLLATLEALLSPQKELAWMRFLCLHPGVGPVKAEKLYAPIAKLFDPVQANRLMATIMQAKAPETSAFLNRFQPAPTPYENLQAILKFYDSTSLFLRRYDEWDTRRKDLDVVLKVSQKYQSLTAFLEAFKLDPDQEARQQRGDAGKCITLITVHSAKGTESDIVYIMRVQQGTFPFYKCETEEEIEEERRILYVAVTRARKELFLTSAGIQGRHPAPSPFLTQEMLEDLNPDAKKSVRGSMSRRSGSGSLLTYDYDDF